MNLVRLSMLVLVLVGVTSGCSLTPDGRSKNQPHATSEKTTIEKLGDSFSRFRQTKDEKPKAADEKLAGWNWALAIPGSATRAELIDTALPNDSLASYVPSLNTKNEIALVTYTESTMLAGNESESEIVKVGETEIENWGQLHHATEAAIASGEMIQVEFLRGGRAGATSHKVDLESSKLRTITQAIAGDEDLIRVSDGGNSSVVIREGAVHCMLTARIEREHGILHLVTSLGVSSGRKQVLPVEVRASCNGRPLQCLTVSDALELLYGDPMELAGGNANEASQSFAKVSEGQNYLIPSNFERLEKRNQDSETPRTDPCLATMPGVAFPGSAVLGDARATSAFLMQQQLYEPGQPESVGWILFANEALKTAQQVDIDLDLGAGPKRIRFTLPSQ